MNKTSLFAAVAGFALVFVLDFLFHGVLLSGLYQETATIWRPEEEMGSLYPLMSLNQLLFVIAFLWFYTKGYESGKPGLGQGLRFGLYVGILFAATYSLGWYVVLPIPFILNVGWVVSAFATSVALGAIIGLIYKK